MDYSAPGLCPVCGGSMAVTRLECPGCGSALTGHFTPCRFCALKEKELRFVETFLRCRGSIKDVEKALGISYPTVRNMLDSALRALSLDEPPKDPLKRESRETARREVLDLLQAGDIDAQEAAKRLQAIGREHT